jgi:hypothetical protein
MVQIYSPAEAKDWNRNVYFQPPTANAYHINFEPTFANWNLYCDFPTYQYYMSGSGHEGSSKQPVVDPIEQQSLIPVNGGDAHDTAHELTEVVGINGFWIQVENPDVFRVGDEILISALNNTPALILTVSGDWLQINTSVSQVGDKIWLNRSYDGTPDIGAVERQH